MGKLNELRIEEHYTDTAGFTDHVFPGKGWFTLLRLYSPEEAFFTMMNQKMRNDGSRT